VRLVYRFLLAFLLLAAVSTGGLGWYLRQDRRDAETMRYTREVEKACASVRVELERQGEIDRRLVTGACGSSDLVDRVASSIERGDELGGMSLGYAKVVPATRASFGLDEMVLGTSQGDVIGADPEIFFRLPRADIEAAILGDDAHWRLRLDAAPALVTRCAHKLRGGRAVGLFGAHHLLPLVDRFGKVLDVKVALGAAPPPRDDIEQASCALVDAAGARLPIVVFKPKTELYLALRQIDQAVLTAALSSMGLALVLAVFLARRIGRPIAELADEARKVAADQARPIRVRGSGEIADLTRAFDKMLEDLAATRRRLAATSRVAAWREVARRVAHEVKNPLAPIRAAVETLRRLRAREDPAFDGYFDEATRTVLDEVHRIANIVTEFTRFARLPSPHPTDVDIEELVRHVVGLHKSAAGAVKIGWTVRRRPPAVRADRDQLVQVLTNLVQNALDAVRGRAAGEISIGIDFDGTSHVALTVKDNGPGIAPEIAARLFEPYATTKGAAGTGLGLAIAQRIAIEHNGELSLVSAPGGGGGGAAFRLVLPIEGPPPVSEGAGGGAVGGASAD
jgi:two-component system, NtrC family, nitrogen regulation sensor histidine kinase NtrY